MYLVEGTNRAMVLDAGYFDAKDAANLYETARKIVGAGKPIDLIIGHPHPDVIAHPGIAPVENHHFVL